MMLYVEEAMEESPALGGLTSASEATWAELRAEMAGVLRRTWGQEQALEAMENRVKDEEAACRKLADVVDADVAMGSEARVMLKALTQDVESYRRLAGELEAVVKPYAILGDSHKLHVPDYSTPREAPRTWRTKCGWRWAFSGAAPVTGDTAIPSDVEVCLICSPSLDLNKLSEEWRQALEWELLEAWRG